jgi:gluconate 2-dehydrogenase gamma chain
MQRRELLRVLGGATALALLPVEAVAAWTRVASGRAVADGLSDGHLALVGAIADTIIPRTDTPGATDVGVPAFVNVIVGENYAEQTRTAFIAGLDAIDAYAKSSAGSAFVELAPADRASFVESIENGERSSDPGRTYWRLKGLVVHGYFTSEPVMKQVLKTEIMPGKFDGAAPMPAARTAGEVHRHG